MSVSGQKETYRAHAFIDAPVGGTTNNAEDLTAPDDRRIVGVAIDDTGGGANVQVEVTFSTNEQLGNANIEDSTQSQVVIMGGAGLTVMGLNIMWHAGEEIHIHTRNNSGAAEEALITIYYEEP